MDADELVEVKRRKYLIELGGIRVWCRFEDMLLFKRTGIKK